MSVVLIDSPVPVPGENQRVARLREKFARENDADFIKASMQIRKIVTTFTTGERRNGGQKFCFPLRTLWKEVDAKIQIPERTFTNLVWGRMENMPPTPEVTVQIAREIPDIIRDMEVKREKEAALRKPVVLKVVLKGNFSRAVNMGIVSVDDLMSVAERAVQVAIVKAAKLGVK